MTVMPVSRLVGRNTSSEVLRSAPTILGSGFCQRKERRKLLCGLHGVDKMVWSNRNSVMAGPDDTTPAKSVSPFPFSLFVRSLAAAVVVVLLQCVVD